MPRLHPASRPRWTPRPVPPLPHPSWSRAGEGGERQLAVSTLSAADFWKRLGL